MNSYPILLDVHTHTVSSGHGTTDTATDLAKAASGNGLQILGISDHGPDTPGSCKASYFQNLRLAPKERFGVKLLYGVELNIRNVQGDVDLPAEIISGLDYAIVSMHPPVRKPGTLEENTAAYIAAMRHPKVRFLGHIDDGRYPIDFERVLQAAGSKHIYPEINNGSLMPEAYRTKGHKNCPIILEICKKLQLPILLSSDSHGGAHIGDMQYALPLLNACDFPAELVLNSQPERFLEILENE